MLGASHRCSTMSPSAAKNSKKSVPRVARHDAALGGSGDGSAQERKHQVLKKPSFRRGREHKESPQTADQHYRRKNWRRVFRRVRSVRGKPLGGQPRTRGAQGKGPNRQARRVRGSGGVPPPGLRPRSIVVSARTGHCVLSLRALPRYFNNA